MSQLKNVVDPFGEVNVYPAAGGKVRVVATILMEPHTRRGADRHRPGRLRLHGQALRRRGRQPRPVADLRRPQKAAQRNHARRPETVRLPGPQDRRRRRHHLHLLGGRRRRRRDRGRRRPDAPTRPSGTSSARRATSAPARSCCRRCRYFVDRFRDAPWGFYVFITDGELHDLDEVKAYSTRLARDIAAGRRNPLKFVLIGIGPSVNETQMEELDDLDTRHGGRSVGPQAGRRDARAAGDLRRGGGQERSRRRQRPHPRSSGPRRQGLQRHGPAGLPGVRDAGRRRLLHAGGQRQRDQSSSCPIRAPRPGHLGPLPIQAAAPPPSAPPTVLDAEPAARLQDGSTRRSESPNGASINFEFAKKDEQTDIDLEQSKDE